MKEKVVPDDELIYSGLVKYKSFKFTTKLYATKSKISFLKKGLFTTKYKEFDSIDIKDKSNKILVNNKEDKISIETQTKTYEITCSNLKEAKKITSKLKEAISGEDKLDKTKKIIDNVGKKVLKVAGIVGGTAGIAVKTIDDLLNTYEDIKSIANRSKLK